MTATRSPDPATAAISPETARAGDASADAPSLAGSVQVYDPPMCCPTGMCGPGVDPAVLQIARDLRWLTAQGASVERFGLSQDPQAFVSNARVAGLLQAFGDGALPAVLVNAGVLSHGRYASRDEMVAALAAAVRHAPVQGPASGSPRVARSLAMLPEPGATGERCEPGSACC